MCSPSARLKRSRVVEGCHTACPRRRARPLSIYMERVARPGSCSCLPPCGRCWSAGALCQCGLPTPGSRRSHALTELECPPPRFVPGRGTHAVSGCGAPLTEHLFSCGSRATATAKVCANDIHGLHVVFDCLSTPGGRRFT